MKSIGLFSQIGAVLVAFGIGYYYVQPTITEIGVIQTDIAEYQAERKKIEDINSTLDQKTAIFQGISPADKKKLAVYMPPLIDDLSILRDITFIMEEAQLVNNGLSYGGGGEENSSGFSEADDAQSSNVQQAVPHSFSVEVQGSYDQIKQFLLLLEQNEYPLEVHEMSLQTDDFDIMTASMTLVTYADQLSLVTDNQ